MDKQEVRGEIEEEEDDEEEQEEGIDFAKNNQKP